jgi:hypothetical protein
LPWKSNFFLKKESLYCRGLIYQASFVSQIHRLFF